MVESIQNYQLYGRREVNTRLGIIAKTIFIRPKQAAINIYSPRQVTDSVIMEMGQAFLDAEQRRNDVTLRGELSARGTDPIKFVSEAVERYISDPDFRQRFFSGTLDPGPEQKLAPLVFQRALSRLFWEAAPPYVSARRRGAR